MEQIQAAATPDPANGMKPESLIRLIGICALVLGALPTAYYLWMGAYLAKAAQEGKIPADRLAFFLTVLAVSLILPAARLIAGVGLARLRAWGRKLGLVVFTIDFLLGFAAGLNFSIYCYRIRNISAMFYNEIVSVNTANMFSTYVMALVALLFIAMLNRKAVKEFFSSPSLDL